MIHGMCLTGSCWDNFRKFYEEKNYDCIAPTLRHHKLEKCNPRLGKVSLLDYVDDLETELEELDLERPPIIMGHSMGGLLAQLLACRVKARALILLTPAAPRGVNSLKLSVIRTFVGVMTKWKFWKKPFKFSRAAANYAIFNCLSDDQKEELFGQMVHESGQAAFEIGLWPLDREKASEVDYSKINCPILFLAAGRDKISPASTIKKAADMSKIGSLWEYPLMGHMLLLEDKWERVANFIYHWLGGVDLY